MHKLMSSDIKVFLFHTSETPDLANSYDKQYHKAVKILHLCALLSSVEAEALQAEVRPD